MRRALVVCVIDARKQLSARKIFRGVPLFFKFFIFTPFTRDMRTASERELEREHNESY